MGKWTLLSLLAAAVVVGVVVIETRPAPLPTEEEMKARMKSAVEAMKSYDVEVRTKTEGEAGQVGGLVRYRFLAARQDGRVVEKVRQEGKGPGIETLAVCDGVHLWEEIRNPDPARVYVVKWKAPEALGAQNLLLAQLAFWWGQFDLKVTGTDSVDGRRMIVAEGPSRSSSKKIADQRLKLWVGAADCLVRRTEITLLVPGEKPQPETADYVTLNADVAFEPSMFAYSPPPGAKVRDMTKLPKEAHP